MAPPTVTNAELARRYGIHRHTVSKWRRRKSTEDASARPHRLCTTLSEAQEKVVVAIREPLLGNHPFDRQSAAADIEHRLIPPRHPQTNGTVQRFNGRILEIPRGNRFDSSADLKQALENYQWAYNHQIPQRALGHVTPIQALKAWQEKRPELFVKRVYNITGLDI